MKRKYYNIQFERVKLGASSIFETRAFGEESPKYYAIFILDKVKNADTIKEIQDIENTIKSETSGKFEFCLKDGDSGDMSSKPEYAGAMVLRATKSGQTGSLEVYDERGNLMSSKDSHKFGYGCRVSARISMTMWTYAGKKGATAYLNQVQLVEKSGEVKRSGAIGYYASDDSVEDSIDTKEDNIDFEI